MTRVYADYAAGAPLRPAAARALADALASGASNASSVHWEGARARALLESAREEIAAAIGARPLEIVFTSGATEANNLALSGVAGAASRPLRIAVPATEHSSVRRAAEALAAQGHEPCVLPVAPDGLTDPGAVTALRPDLLTVALVNAETGVVQPCVELAAAARRAATGRAVAVKSPSAAGHAAAGHAAAGGSARIYVHIDAAQAAASLPIDVTALDCDLLTLSGHKVGAPAGTGALYVREGTMLAPLHHGGPQERGLRPGTENVAALAAFATAVAAARIGRASEGQRLAALTARLRSGVLALVPRARVAGDTAPRAPHVLDIGFPGLVGEALVTALDLAGVAASAGSACAAGASAPSHVLLAMGWSRDEAASAVRFSFGWASTTADVERILEILPGIVARADASRGGGNMARARVVVAMSGGVDSSVAAALLRDAGHEVIGVSMLLSDSPAATVRVGQGCCSLEDFRDARRVAERLAIPYYVWNLVEPFRAKVQDVFVREYVAGRTPNPCVLCNQDLKFDELWRRAGALGADFVATGHYARIVTAVDGRPRLMRARDLAKDQSYFLFGLSPVQLARTLFPLGELTKDEVRAVARRLDLGVAEKPESQEVCFVPDRDYAGFVERRTGASAPPPGAVVDERGQVVAHHGGVHRFTVGQRRGLGVSGGAARYVTAIDAATATVHVGERSRLLSAGLVAERVRWMGAPVADATVRIRHRHAPVAARLRMVDADRGDDRGGDRMGDRLDDRGGDRVEARFAEPVAAVTPGQAVVFYQGDEVVGGGWIAAAIATTEDAGA